jgi:hypothetical protein
MRMINYMIKKVNVGICIAPTQPFRAALGAESRVCYPDDRQANVMSVHVLWPLGQVPPRMIYPLQDVNWNGMGSRKFSSASKVHCFDKFDKIRYKCVQELWFMANIIAGSSLLTRWPKWGFLKQIRHCWWIQTNVGPINPLSVPANGGYKH